MEHIELEKIVKTPTWKATLLELIISERVDPWDVDIVKISDGFLRTIKEMKTLDLFIPANMILASAILLRYKSHNFVFKEETIVEEVGESDEFIEDNSGSYRPESELSLLSRIPPKRPITINELVEEIDKVIKYEEKRGKIKKRRVEAIINIKLEAIDIEKHMESIYDMILDLMGEEQHVLFSKLIYQKNHNRDVIHALLSVLHLTQEKKIDIEQSEFFGDIKIKASEVSVMKNK